MIAPSPPASDPPVTFDLDGYVPFFITAIANRWTATSSRRYLREFGIGVVEWRVLASLAARDQASSADVVTLVGMDAAAVSRAMRALERRGLVEPVKGRFVGRTKPYRMTAAGERLCLAVRDLALSREAVLLGGLDASDRSELLRLLRLLHSRLGDL
jgi:DNA-binding MarR family transcriptional regulator